MKIRPVSEGGSAVIEFAFVLPVLLILFFGIVEFSVAFYNKAVITNACREAARAGIVYVAPDTHPSDDTIADVATNYSENNLIAFDKDAAAPEVVVTHTDSVEFPQGLLTVSMTYDYSGLGLGSLLSAITGPITLSASATMKNE